MADKNPLDDIVDELVVFQNPDPNHPLGEYFSNNPLWNDSRIRDHWLKRNKSKDQTEEDVDPQTEGEDEEDEDLLDYESMTNEQLRTELAGRGLAVDGKKDVLIARLQEDDEKATEEE